MKTVRSGLLAGFISSTAWMFIATAVDMAKSAVLVGGVIFLVVTAVGTSVIAYLVGRSRGA